MFASLLGAVRVDVDRQIDWAKGEVRRRTRYTALTGILAGAGALASLGAVIVGLIALHSWLAIQTGQFVAHAMIGLGLLLLALILFTFVFARRPPRLAARPLLQLARPAALLGTLGSGSAYGKVVSGGAQPLDLAMSRIPRFIAM
jgi:cytochrome bd-type quinol oxidase subunit 1